MAYTIWDLLHDANREFKKVFPHLYITVVNTGKSSSFYINSDTEEQGGTRTNLVSISGLDNKSYFSVSMIVNEAIKQANKAAIDPNERIFKGCFGVEVCPREPDGHINIILLVEDDGFWREVTTFSSFWVTDLQRVLENLQNRMRLMPTDPSGFGKTFTKQES